MVRVAVLVSGGGTNLQALIDAQARGELDGGEIAAVISTKEGAYALERAKNAGIPGYVIPRKAYANNQEMTIAMVEKLKELDIQLVVLAGCMVIFTHELVDNYPNAIMNVHPALIPSFCGKGFYGLHVHEAALAYGVKLSGATVHFVSEECDGGPSSPRKLCPSWRVTPPKRCRSASWKKPNGSCCPKRSPCSVRVASPWKAETFISAKEENICRPLISTPC